MARIAVEDGDDREADPVVDDGEEQLALLLRGFDVDGLRPRRWRRRVLQQA